MKKKLCAGLLLAGALAAVIFTEALAADSDPYTNGWGFSKGRIVYYDDQQNTGVCIDAADLQKLYELSR